MIDQRDINAAHALVKLANDASHLLQIDLSSNKFRGNKFRGDEKVVESGQSLHSPFLKRKRSKREKKDGFSLSAVRRHRYTNIEEKESPEKDHSLQKSELSDGPLLITSLSKKSQQHFKTNHHDKMGMNYIESKTKTKKHTSHKAKTRGDSLGNWKFYDFRSETLEQIVNLPTPPAILMQPTNMKERFKDMRVLKNYNTISPSCEAIKDYFQREEALRYLIPDRAFSYTTLDGRKSMVAPLRRCYSKPLTKARGHFMLKENRPPNFTVLCLVRDAAARLPGSVGTRADVCTLVRDSQFIIEEISDLQAHQVVSGALDRLHYEQDPCVRFDRERHLWVYLHGEREDEDFELDVTSSRKTKKREFQGTS